MLKTVKQDAKKVQSAVKDLKKKDDVKKEGSKEAKSDSKKVAKSDKAATS